MSLQVGNNNFGNIGRMFARQNVPAVYGRQKAAAGALEADNAAGGVDSVSLSPQAPRPLSARTVEEALETAGVVANGGKLSAGQTEKLREDRVFRAVSALAAMGFDGQDDRPVAWPGGIPVPTRDELEAAKRRLAQRLDSTSEAADIETVQRDRMELLRRMGKRDFSSPVSEAMTIGEALATT